jgi:hypothetical protein
MVDAVAVTWQSLKDLWEDFFLLIMLNVIWSLAALLAVSPLFVWRGTSLVVALVLGIVVSLPLAIVSGALCFVTNQITREIAVSFRTFVTGLRRYWAKSLAVALINWLALLLIASNFQFYAFVLKGTWTNIVLSLWVVMGLYWLIAQIYWFPMILELETEKLLPALRNALVLVIITPGFTLVLAVILLALTLLGVVLTVPLLLFLAALVLLITNRATHSRLALIQQRHESREKEGDQD